MTNPSKPIRVLNIVSTFCYNGGIESILLNILNPTTASAFTMTFAASPSEKNALREEARALGVEFCFAGNLSS